VSFVYILCAKQTYALGCVYTNSVRASVSRVLYQSLGSEFNNGLELVIIILDLNLEALNIHMHLVILNV